MRPPRALPIRLVSRQTAAALSCAVLTAGAAAAVVAVATADGNQNGHRAARPTTIAAGTETARFSPTGSLTVHWRGNGHGHGMSQYGARGAALKGLSYKQILAFYYPGTKLARIAPSSVRVWLSNTATSLTTVLGNAAGLKLTGYGALPTDHYSEFRLAPYGSGLVLQALTAGGKWKALRRGLPAAAKVSSSQGWVQLRNADGSSSRYHGTIRTVRSGKGELTINRVRMDQYVKGSVPLEVSASWPAAAVKAQAIAARSYAEISRASAGSGSLYDICDTTNCQSYGGMGRYTPSGQRTWTADPAAISGNQRTVLRYQGSPVFAQYSASNGGATVDGGTPYLVGRSDPYDTSASGDPYLSESQKVRAAALASSYGLKSVNSIQVTKRDGNGPWGGRVVSAYVNGTTSAGKKAHISTTGYDLGSALGVWTDYLRIGS